ncbi:uncharacterized protein A4U43_C05F2420 [Asparagus officinalis]|uniref:Uncharacterized protein n=1 Tax=Asparagus officinalis TaxID=4686 RepID=A0A5P1ESZ5_ASPOF|nr:uncharacterized protein A4U43_C05F2420 [Asparagus officinalis]
MPKGSHYPRNPCIPTTNHPFCCGRRSGAAPQAGGCCCAIAAIAATAFISAGSATLLQPAPPVSVPSSPVYNLHPPLDKKNNPVVSFHANIVELAPIDAWTEVIRSSDDLIVVGPDHQAGLR